ncbi:PIN-like domain-containing protein [Pseudomonas brassicacearum]|uniref:PIN like domain-containing protein n=1 Tax=Pseudomonas brassicacearum subsp. neoaurantiaca TaxID=494916 RepID=A0A7V8UDV9_9PSED|nr:PIN domain-containing protein [Pseudomonas brassicacearum]MBA1379754.1 hypothetical protein [Pseudomonas brassicacearum subsp. neoaurantiaca]
MKKEFPGYFANHSSDLERLWEGCLFVLDANVLLNLYRYSDATRAELLKVFNSLAERLWVPHQVAQEYLVNRLKVVGEQVKVYEETVKNVETLKKSLENVNHHPFVSLETLKDSVAVFERLVLELNDNKVVHEERISSDEIKDQLEVLLDGRVGEAFEREKMEAVLRDGKVRYEQKIPPGYKDGKKGGDSIVFSELCKPFGDYVVWLQILEKAKGSDKSVIFVTGDNKEDWWLSFQGKTVGPQPDLIHEFFSETNNSFYMYSPDRFLERANKFLQQETSQNAMNEIRSLRDEDEESALEAALLDVAINGAWPSLTSDPAKVELPWNEEYNRKVIEIAEMKKTFVRKSIELNHRLEAEKVSLRKNSTDYDNIMSGAYGAVSSEFISSVKQAVIQGKTAVRNLQAELAVIRDEIIVLGGHRKNLAEKYL